MLEGLEATEISFADSMDQNRSIRLDSGFFGKTALQTESILRAGPWAPLATQATRVASFGAYALTNQVEYVDDGVPFLRCLNIKNGQVAFNNALFITPEANALLSKSEVRSGMVLLTMSGTVGEAAVALPEWPYPVNSNQDIAKITPKRSLDPHVLAAFLNGKFGKAQMQRLPVGSIQQHIFLWQLENLAVPLLSSQIQRRIASVALAATRRRQESCDLYTQAEDLLLSELGLQDWQPEDPLTYEASSSDVFAAVRLDAEHFRPKYRELHTRFERAGMDAVSLGEVCPSPVNGVEIRNYCEDGIPYLRVGDIKMLDVDPCTVVRVAPGKAEGLIDKVRLEPGDVLVSRSGSLGVAGVVTESWTNSVISSHLIRIRCQVAGLDPYYLALFLQSSPGKMQIEEWSNGGVQPEINQPSLKRVLIPLLGPSQQKKIREGIEAARVARDESKALLEKAKRAVEIAIEHGEEAAGEYLDGKAYVQSSALPAMTKEHRYFSNAAVKAYLEDAKLQYVPETVNAYVSRMKREGRIYSAGRGWYSAIAEPFELELEPVESLVRDLESGFPALDFSCWSTGQINPYLHHMLGKFVCFVYVDRDAMSSVFDALQELEYQAYLNPTRREAEKSFVIGEKTVVVRPSVAKAPVEGHFSRIEKILVDLHKELQVFGLVESDEFHEAAQALVSSRRIELAKLITYARQRRVDWRTLFSRPGDIIATGGSQ